MARDPLDLDGDGRAGGSIDELDQLTVEALRDLCEAEAIECGDIVDSGLLKTIIRAARIPPAATPQETETMSKEQGAQAAEGDSAAQSAAPVARTFTNNYDHPLGPDEAGNERHAAYLAGKAYPLSPEVEAAAEAAGAFTAEG